MGVECNHSFLSLLIYRAAFANDFGSLLASQLHYKLVGMSRVSEFFENRKARLTRLKKNGYFF